MYGIALVYFSFLHGIGSCSTKKYAVAVYSPWKSKIQLSFHSKFAWGTNIRIFRCRALKSDHNSECLKLCYPLDGLWLFIYFRFGQPFEKLLLNYNNSNIIFPFKVNMYLAQYNFKIQDLTLHWVRKSRHPQSIC